MVLIKNTEDGTEIFKGLTPTAVKLKRKGNYSVRIEKEGYETLLINVTNQKSDTGGVATAGKCLAGGCIGFGIDHSTGAGLNLIPNPINAELVITK